MSDVGSKKVRVIEHSRNYKCSFWYRYYTPVFCLFQAPFTGPILKVFLCSWFFPCFQGFSIFILIKPFGSIPAYPGIYQHFFLRRGLCKMIGGKKLCPGCFEKSFVWGKKFRQWFPFLYIVAVLLMEDDSCWIIYHILFRAPAGLKKNRGDSASFRIHVADISVLQSRHLPAVRRL